VVDNFVGEWYPRGKGRNKTWRNRRTGVVLSASGIKENKRVGKTNQALIFDGTRYRGVEKTKFHFSGFDPRQSAPAKKRFEKRVRSRAEIRAIKAKSRRR